MELDRTRFEPVNLDKHHQIFLARLPSDLNPEAQQFQKLWDLHPAEYHTLKMHGKLVKTPRWQQAYGRDYRYTGAKTTLCR